MGKCKEYVQEAQKDIEDPSDAINAVFHCLEFIAQEVDEWKKKTSPEK